jgi:hypothetical protein
MPPRNQKKKKKQSNKHSKRCDVVSRKQRLATNNFMYARWFSQRSSVDFRGIESSQHKTHVRGEVSHLHSDRRGVLPVLDQLLQGIALVRVRSLAEVLDGGEDGVLGCSVLQQTHDERLIVEVREHVVLELGVLHELFDLRPASGERRGDSLCFGPGFEGQRRGRVEEAVLLVRLRVAHADSPLFPGR